ncbi:hypothetical protein GCM10010492_06750 [Saccharothrix mutabilis subsp. mutabilis]|uniref:Uncharacterized protein n=1 Tax=Saccharothrix mutabilis subsp. mutabilis TaxID=66855 RepID=A0ABN0T3P6_9PSEU
MRPGAGPRVDAGVVDPVHRFRNVTVSDAHNRCSTSTCSVLRAPRPANSSFNASYSTDAHAKPQPPAAEHVDLGHLLGHQRRLALRQHEHPGHQLHRRRHRREVPEQYEHLVERGVAGVPAPARPGVHPRA